MDRLASWSQAAVSLGLRHQLSMVYIAHSRGHARLTLSLDIGARIPIESTSMGRAWLCGLAEASRAQVLDEIKASLGRGWPAARAALARADEQYRSLGFVTSEGEWAADISAVGAPVPGPTPGETYALSIGGPSTVLTHERLFKLLGPRLAEAAQEIAEVLRLQAAR
jgi:DNA-binding IclR family transcriptional regulator